MMFKFLDYGHALVCLLSQDHCLKLARPDPIHESCDLLTSKIIMAMDDENASYRITNNSLFICFTWLLVSIQGLSGQGMFIPPTQFYRYVGGVRGRSIARKTLLDKSYNGLEITPLLCRRQSSDDP